MKFKKYLSFTRCGFLDGCANRMGFLTGMLSNFIQIAVLYFVWKSIFQYQEIVNGFTWPIMKNYVFASFLCNSMLSFGFELDTAKKIIRGDFIMDLLKPVHYRRMLFFRMLGTAGMEGSLTLIFTGILYYASHITRTPAGTLALEASQTLSLWQLLLFLISLLAGQIIKFSIQYLFSLLCFYTDNAYGVVKAREVLSSFLSGALIPLSMFPPACQTLLHLLPFQGIVFIPCSIFTGAFTKTQALQSVLFQLFWIVILWIWGSLAWKKACAALSLYGG